MGGRETDLLNGGGFFCSSKAEEGFPGRAFCFMCTIYGSFTSTGGLGSMVDTLVETS